MSGLSESSSQSNPLSPQSVIFGYIPRPSAAPVMTALFSASAVLHTRDYCVLDLCLTTMPLITIMPPLGRLPLGPLCPIRIHVDILWSSRRVSQARSTQRHFLPACILQSVPTSSCRVRHLRAYFLRGVLQSRPVQTHVVQRRRQAPEPRLLRFLQHFLVFFSSDLLWLDCRAVDRPAILRSIPLLPAAPDGVCYSTCTPARVLSTSCFSPISPPHARHVVRCRRRHAP